ncbi:DJ-1/PfpI family protein [Cohnella nanjingensis]|uniref:DJ-1/PfpI family protein n=1 Tax=Cohnella nanjingensis TaxID=1387779 RepID=A0A7X0VD17_9BACL|nr:DJ-1/PfpI family protein [Cohnella nanjingensis]
MKAAFVLFDGMTTLDFAGFFDGLTSLNRLGHEVEYELCGPAATVTDDRGMRLGDCRVDPDLSVFDLVFVPGGFRTRELRFDESFVGWLRTAARAPWIVSVCTGALLLGAAGLLAGRRATTNPSAYELLAPDCAEVLQARIVRDGNVVTGAGVATSVDIGLFVVEMLTNVDTARQAQHMMDYPYYRPGRANRSFSVYPSLSCPGEAAD